MARLELLFFGGYQVSLGPLPVTGFESDKVRALLAYLAVDNEHHHRREKLAGLFWPDLPESRARRNLSQALYNLRSILHDRQAEVPFLISQREEVHWNPASHVWLDTSVFSTLLAASQTHEHPSLASCPTCLDRLGQAAGLYQGDFLAGVCLDCGTIYEEWVMVTRERLRRQAMQALQNLAGSLEQNGELKQALAYTWQLLDIEPLWEPAHRQAMHLLAASGQRSAALLQYETCRRTLAEELGIGPDAETTRLYETILASNEIQPIENAGERRIITPPRHNLPSAIMPFIGRQSELSKLAEYLGDSGCRLITILGPGGSGKTRLAIESARNHLANFPDGIYFLPLSAVASVDSLLSNLTKILGITIHDQGPAKDQLLDYLRQKNVLLLLDSFEGILEATELVTEMLKTAPALKVLATSRLILNIQYETHFPLEGLEYERLEPSGQTNPSEAVELFLSGAHRIQPAFDLTAENQADTAAICQLVQGIPLAILLAAAWVETLSPAEILAEMRSSYDFLAVDWSDIPPRQRSLRATFDYSWNLLSPREQALFKSLSIFQGGFTYQAAKQVTGASLRELRSLIGKSFLGHAASGRYGMHDMLHQYGADKLAGFPEYDTYHNQHSDYYLKLIADREPDLKGARQQVGMNELDPELANIRAAWDWAVDQGHVEILGRSIESLGLFYEMRILYQEGERAYRLAAEMIAAREYSPERIKILVRMQTWLARFHRLQGNTGKIQTLHQDCMERLEDLPAELDVVSDKAFLLLEMGNAALHTDHEAANHRYLESLKLYRTMEDDWGAANVFSRLGEAATLTSRFGDAIASYEKGLALFRRLGDPRGAANALIGLGHLLYRVGRTGEGEQCLREMISLFKELGDRGGIARSQLNLARAFFFEGRFTELTELFWRCNPNLKELGLQYDRAHLLGLSTLAHSHLEIYDTAALQAQELVLLTEEIEYPRFFAAAYASFGLIAVAKQEYSLARDDLQKFVDVTAEIGNPDEHAAGIGSLGGLYIKAGDLQLARQNLYEAMQQIVELKAIWGASWTLPWAALYLAKRGDLERSVEVYAMASQLPIVANSRWFAEVVEKDILAACVNLSDEVIAAARMRGQKADLFATATELLEDLKS